MPSSPLRVQIAARLVRAEQQLRSAQDLRKLMNDREDHLVPRVERMIATLMLYVRRLEQAMAAVRS